ncbi:MAG: transcription factor S [Candidatus Aenigmarchaeota archaeon]|nr:transcription factor S [Candidatus Aenigmarchaeota archaeon]
MKFCGNCSNLMRVKAEADGKYLYCKSCNTKTKLSEEITIDVSNTTEKKDVIIITESEENTFPVTEIMCPKCNEMRKAQWTMQQTRGGDEPPTRFYQCDTCNWRWREYS